MPNKNIVKNMFFVLIGGLLGLGLFAFFTQSFVPSLTFFAGDYLAAFLFCLFLSKKNRLSDWWWVGTAIAVGWVTIISFWLSSPIGQNLIISLGGLIVVCLFHIFILIRAVDLDKVYGEMGATGPLKTLSGFVSVVIYSLLFLNIFSWLV